MTGERPVRAPTGGGARTGTMPEPNEGMPLETPDTLGAYPRLSESHIALLERYGRRCPTRAGDVLFREGDSTCDFVVVLGGRVAMVEHYGRSGQRVISTHGAGRFLGELNLLTGQSVFLTAVVCAAGEVLVVPAGRLRELVTHDPQLGDLILRAYLTRRSILIGLGTGLRIIGSRYSRDTLRLREFAARNRLPHRWIDLEDDGEADALLRRLGIEPEQTPVVVWRGDRVLRNPTNTELAHVLGLPRARRLEKVWDLVVVGAGPAGLAATVYAASEGLRTLLIDAVASGGQAGTSSRIENYLGFPSGISGAELAERAYLQATKFGAEVIVPARAVAVEPGSAHHRLRLVEEHPVRTRALIIATGARYRRLGLPRQEEFEGAGIYYAATEIEVLMCADRPVAIVGGGNSAGQAALYLADHATGVTLLIRGSDPAKSMSRYLIDAITRTPRIEVRVNTEVRELIGDRHLEALLVEDNRTGRSERIDAHALFVFIGAAPHTDWLADGVALDGGGFVQASTGSPRDEVARQDGGRPRLLLETSADGIFAAGDVRSGSIKRVASAVGEGAMAVWGVHEYLDHSSPGSSDSRRRRGTDADLYAPT